MQRLRESIHIRTMKAKRKVEEISKENIQAFLKKNAFVLFTVAAVVLGRYPAFEQMLMSLSSKSEEDEHSSKKLSLNLFVLISIYNVKNYICRYYSGIHTTPL